MKLSSRLSKLHPSGIRAVMALAAARKKSGMSVIHMEVGQPDFKTPQHIIDEAFKASRNQYIGYTPNAGTDSLRESVAERASCRNKVNVNKENVCITSGGVMAIYLVMMAILENGDEVLVPDPGWPNYLSSIAMGGGKAKPYMLNPDNNYWPDIEDLQSKITPNTKAMIINFPGNPTGAVITSEKMDELINFAESNDLYLISDEIYEDFVFEGKHVSALNNKSSDKVILISGVSKSYSMTGWRIGWIIANEEIIEASAQFVEPIASCPSSISQYAAEAAINGPQDCVKEMLDAYSRRAGIAMSVLGKAGLVVNKPQGAFYMMIDISNTGQNSDDFVRNLLDDVGVAVAPGQTFGHSSMNSIRISTAISDADVMKGSTLIRDYITSKSL
ncbi:MAG: pyridoxal phosphate-dependent aminotransferase [Emcibacteraceae bacterium]|nr:pyridoxal phosphate-dependent aminotransferase [Emcibacteraceae bacterium]